MWLKYFFNRLKSLMISNAINIKLSQNQHEYVFMKFQIDSKTLSSFVEGNFYMVSIYK